MKKLLSLTLVLMFVLCSTAMAATATATPDPNIPVWSDWYKKNNGWRAGQQGGSNYSEPTASPTPVPAMAGDDHEHNWVTDGSDYADEEPTDDGNGYSHTIHGITTYYTHCTICKMDNTYYKKADYVENHKPSAADPTVCRICGGKITANTPVTTCHHLNAIATDSTVQTKDIEPAKIGHKVTKIITTTMKCNDCGKTFEEKSTWDGYEVHVADPDTGKCLVCGAVVPASRPSTPTVTATPKPAETQKPGSSTGSTGSSSGSSDMPKTGNTGMAREAWIALSACCFIALCAVRKVRAK